MGAHGVLVATSGYVRPQQISGVSVTVFSAVRCDHDSGSKGSVSISVTVLNTQHSPGYTTHTAQVGLQLSEKARLEQDV